MLLCQVAELKITVDGLEKERDFYFGKLREVEMLCQEKESEGSDDVKKVANGIMGILYATEVNSTGEVKLFVVWCLAVVIHKTSTSNWFDLTCIMHQHISQACLIFLIIPL